MKAEIYSKVENGKLKYGSTKVRTELAKFEGKNIIIKIELKKKKRSNQQNKYYWGCIIPLAIDGVLDVWGESWSEDRVHAMLLKECPIYEHKPNLKTGEIKSVAKGSSDMTTTEMMLYWEMCAKLLAEYFGIYVPQPNEQTQLEIND